MRKIFHITILLTVLSLNSLLVFSQTKVAVYNGHSAQKENKIFAASLVKSFTNSEWEYEASDETSNINALLKQQGYKTKNKNVPDTIIAAVCDKFEVDYMINFILYPEKTTKNVTVSFINANTFLVERTKTLTCNNLKNKNQEKQITDELADFFLHRDSNVKDEKEENETAEQTAIAKQPSLNGHYISLGSSIISSGYYGGLGLAYEYRYRIFGFNAAIGAIGLGGNFRNYEGFSVNAGCKFYLSNKIRFVRNLYFNINPLCYFGQDENDYSSYEEGDNYNIIRTTEHKYSLLFGAKIFFGYCPVWHVRKNVSLGFNIDVGFDMGFKSNYEYKYWIPVTWDMGFVIKLK